MKNTELKGRRILFSPGGFAIGMDAGTVLEVTPSGNHARVKNEDPSPRAIWIKVGDIIEVLAK